MHISLSVLVCWPSVKAGKAGCPSAVDYMTTWCDNVQSKPIYTVQRSLYPQSVSAYAKHCSQTLHNNRKN